MQANSKCSGSTIHTMCGSGTPLMENCSKDLGSTIHTCMEVEPQIQREASMVYLIYYFLAYKLNYPFIES